MSPVIFDGSLASDACHIWSVDLSEQALAGARLDVLDDSERERAARFRHERDRERFALCRSAVRILLGRYLRRDPAQLRFVVGEHGRPHLAARDETEGDAMSSVEFNVTHSGDLALVSIATHGPLGVDVEALREVRDAIDLAARYFDSTESRLVAAAPAEERTRVFLTCWTRKEAALKSIGAGLSRPAHQLYVGATTEERTLTLPWAKTEHRVTIKSFVPGSGYIGACAVPAAVKRVEFWQFDPTER